MSAELTDELQDFSIEVDMVLLILCSALTRLCSAWNSRNGLLGMFDEESRIQAGLRSRL